MSQPSEPVAPSAASQTPPAFPPAAIVPNHWVEPDREPVPATPSSYAPPAFPPAAIVPNHYVDPHQQPAPSGAQFAPYVPYGEAGAEQSYSTLPPSNLAVGVAAGVGLGLLAAIAWAGFAIISGREFLVLGLLIGFAVAFGFHKFGHTRGVVAGIAASLITFAMYILAIFIETAGFVVKELGVSWLDSLRLVVENGGEVVSAFFTDFLGVAFLAISVLAAFKYAYDKKSFDRRNGR